MSANALRDFGQLFGTLAQQQTNIADNLSANDPGESFVTTVTSNAVLAGTIIANSLTYPTDSFILDHPVYCNLDSSVLKLDGGYVNNVAPFPLTFPIVIGIAGSELYRVEY